MKPYCIITYPAERISAWREAFPIMLILEDVALMCVAYYCCW